MNKLEPGTTDRYLGKTVFFWVALLVNPAGLMFQFNLRSHDNTNEDPHTIPTGQSKALALSG